MTDRAALLIDFGSTYTKLRAVDLSSGTLLGSGQGPSTVTTDLTLGMEAALADLSRRLNGLPDFCHRLASSSAAGGLTMITVGLVKELTAEAARVAALGAGARLAGTYSSKLSRRDVASIVGQRPDIILLAGGTDGGNFDVLLHNASALAASGLDCPFVVAGNRSAADEAEEILAGKDVRVTGNVMPEIGRLDVEPARAAIRDVFIERIVHAKGLDRAQGFFDSVLMPTPAAVLEAARLVSEGPPGKLGLGELVVVDIGGATTDVHSVASGNPGEGRISRQVLPEPYLKRTVEGDLGMRHNAASIVDAVGLEAFADLCGLSPVECRAQLAAIESNVERLPQAGDEHAFDDALALSAIRIAVTRHAGTSEIVHTVNGPVEVQRGKDLTAIARVLGTGGALVHAPEPLPLLSGTLYDRQEPKSLRPVEPELLIDHDYVLFAAGLLAEVEPTAAFELARASLKPAGMSRETDKSHEFHINSR